MGYSGSADFNLSVGDSGRFDSQQLSWSNTEFDKQIDISEYFAPDYPVFDMMLAGVNIVDDQQNVTARFVCKLSRSGNQWHLNNRLETPSGTVIAYIMRSQSGNVTLPYDPTGNYATGIWKAYLALSVTESGSDKGIAWVVNFSQCGSKYGNYYFGKWGYYGSGFIDSELYSTFGVAGHLPAPKNKSNKFGPEGESGGYGPADPGSGSTGGSGGPAPTFDGTSDTWVDTPVKPGVLSFGLLNLYKCDNGALNLLGSTLFPSISKPPAPPQTGVTDWVKWSGEVAQWIGDIIFSLSDSIWNKDLIDYIVSVHLIPVDVTGGDMEDIKIGPRTLTGILCRPITEDVIEFDCGTVHVDEYYTNAVDYMTRCRVFIPFFGFVTIKPEYWQSADISLKYLWNVMDGSFIAKLYSTVTRHQVPFTSMIGQYSGCACVHLPLSGANYANMFSQLTGAAAGVAMAAGSGNVAVAATSALAMTGASTAGDMQSSNAYNASSAFYGHATPYLIIERPISHFSTRYVSEQGLPLIMTKRIGDCHGLTICNNPVLNFACSDEEAEEIKAALREGVIV